MSVLNFSSIFSFLSRSTAPAVPSFNVEECFSNFEVGKPENGITEKYIPYIELRRILFVHKDKSGKCPVRSKWSSALIETISDETIPFSHIKGCMSSKSDVTDFEEMKTHPQASSNVNFHINAFRGRVEELAEQVLNGSFDCAVYKGRPAKIIRQEWNGEMWLANDGGSHRSAAVWHIDQEQGRERLLTARVTTNSLSHHFLEQCKNYSIWLFKFQSKPEDIELSSELRRCGILLSAQSDGQFFGTPNDYCIIVRKDNPHHELIASYMRNAFHLSEWVNSLYPTSFQSFVPQTSQSEMFPK